MRKVIFIDFDGTITKVDSCYALIETFAKEGWRELNQLWEQKLISTAECASKTFQLFDVGPNQVQAFLEKLEIDESFINFLAMCKDKGYKTCILSDGYDFNIKTILQKHGIDLTFYSNQLLYKPEEGFGIACPHENESCRLCGTCKKSLIAKLNEAGEQVVYIGDGHSDKCPATVADVVFAKGFLYGYCQEKGIKAIRFESFRDIISSGIL